MMMHKASMGVAALLALAVVVSQQPAQAQSSAPRKTVLCQFAWCPVMVEVVKSPGGAEALQVNFDEIRMAPRYTGATLSWILVGSPDYELRADSVTAKGANAAAAATQFPTRLISANEYAVDNLNTTSLPYDYEIRVYRKGSPAGSTPLISSGTVVNAAN
ncbi:MAG: hypothetical protein U1F41_13475 [Burkholderiales bacterium]